jgi:hypothetical protein
MHNVRKVLYVQRRLDNGMVSRKWENGDEHSRVKFYVWSRVAPFIIQLSRASWEVIDAR